MNQDKTNFGSEDWQRTMEVPVTRGGKKESPGGIFDPWHLNDGGPSESILDSIARSLRESDKMPETLIISEQPPVEEKVSEPERLDEQQVEKTEPAAEEISEEIVPEPEKKADAEQVSIDATMVIPAVPQKEEESAKQEVDKTMVVPEVQADEKKEPDDTIVLPAVESTEEEKPEIVRQKTTGGRLWPPVLMSSIFMIIACIITLTVGIMPVLVEHGFARGMTQIMSPVLNAGEPFAYTNVLLVGVDEDGYRTDTMMVATYDVEQDKVYIMQLPRDTYVSNNGRRDKKLNSAYFSGLDQLKKEVQIAYGIEIHKYVEVNLEGFRMMIDAIGGVEMDVPINMIYDDPTQDFHIYILKGNQVLNGDKAEEFVRFRQNNDGSGYPRGDLQRMEAQREFVKATVKQMISVESLTNINELIKIAQENLKTDLTFDEIYNYCTSVLTLEDGNIEFVDAPGAAMTIPAGSYFFVDYDGARDVAQNYFYATASTMAKMKRVVIQPSVQEQTAQPETNTEPNTRTEPSGIRRDEDDDRPSSPGTGSGSAVTRPDENESDNEPSDSGAMSR